MRDDTSGHYLNMWGGFCYSFDHFNRDGACFATQSGRIFDMISLLASGGYADTAANIGATDDIEVVTKSYREDTQNFKSYFTQYYRNYDTKDFFGDEKII